MIPVAIYNRELSSSFIYRAWKYLEVGRLLHGIALLSTLLSFLFLQLARYANQSDNTAASILFGYLFLHALTIPFFAQLDAYSRFQNFKLVKDMIYRYGFQVRFLKSFLHTKCQREAVLFAARDLGYKSQIKCYYTESNYKWFHILPDFIWSNPEYLLTRNFWLSTFFVKFYHPKYYIN